MTLLASSVRSSILAASELVQPRKFRRDSVLFHQNQAGSGVFLIEGGLVKLIRTSNDGSRFILSVAGPSQLVGEECLTPGSSTYLADCVCVTEVAGYQVPVSIIRRILSDAELSQSFVNYIVARSREMMHKVELLALRDVEHRVLHGLAALASLVKPNASGASFPIPMTQAEIASFIGATRETTSTTLSQLKNRHLVSLSRRLITTVHPDILIEAANQRLTQASTAP